MLETLSITRAYANRHVLLTGASGFVGKVWLVQALMRLPDTCKVYILIRRKGETSALARFEAIVGTSPAFRPLHQKYGDRLGEVLAGRIEVVEGDIGEPGFGLEAAVAARLYRDLDLVINCAGLVDFSPEVRLAIATNTAGGLNALEFTQRCQKAALVHVSTCYVVGSRQGRIEEELRPDYAPNGEPFDAEREYADVLAAIERHRAWAESPESETAAKEEALRRLHERGRSETNARLLRNMIDRERRMQLKKRMVDEGTARAHKWGWTNTYTYSKSLAESMLLRRAGTTRFTVVRPAIVESALAFPFPGWNEGFNTTGPLIYLLGTTWFRHLPADPFLPFDVVPVDLVCNGLSIAGAAVMLNRHQPVYQCGTSERNPLTLGRAVELTGLGRRKYLRANGATALERVVLSRWDPVCIKEDDLFKVSNLRRATQEIGRRARSGKLASWFAEGAKTLADHCDATDRRLDQIESALTVFKPFIYDYRHRFVARAVDALPVVEPEFRFDAEQIDWRRWWIEVHMEGLRRWCFPQIEGKEAETDHPAVPFKMPRTPAATPQPAAATTRS